MAVCLGSFLDVLGGRLMVWVDYMVMAAQHTKGSAAHWFRYLRKDINNFGTLFTSKDIENLFNNEALTLFQRVTIKAAFENDSPTRKYIISLNKPVEPKMVLAIKDKIEAAKNENQF
jgi:hypothetical protein